MSPERRRLHPAAIAVYALGALREAAVPLLALVGVAVLGGGLDESALRRGLLYGAGGTAVAALVGFARWRTTRWWVTEEGIHHRRGLLGIKETDIPLARVQSLDLEQGPVQRLFGVHAVHVQTGGGGARGEIALDALGAADVAALQALGRGSAAPAPAPEAERRLGRGELLLAALTAGQIGVILPALAGLGQLPEVLFEEGDPAGLLPDSGPEVALVVAGLVAAAWLLSVTGSVVAFAGFTVARDGGRLRIRRGLLARREASVPVDRVRAVIVVEGVLRRPLRLAALRMEVVGHAKEPAAAQTLFPLLPRAGVEPFLAALLPELADGLDGLEPLPARARRRYVAAPAAAALALGLAAGVVAGWWWAVVLVAPAAAWGAARHRAAGWRLRDARLAVRSLFLARTTVLAPARHRESHTWAQGPLQRRAALADLGVAFGKRTAARIHHLDAAVARGLFERLR